MEMDCMLSSLWATLSSEGYEWSNIMQHALIWGTHLDVFRLSVLHVNHTQTHILHYSCFLCVPYKFKGQVKFLSFAENCDDFSVLFLFAQKSCSTPHCINKYWWIWMNFHQSFEKCSILALDIRKQPETSLE